MTDVDTLQRGPWGTFLMSLVYLAFYAQLGVLTRVYLDVFVTLGCSDGSWGPCWVTSNIPGGLYGLYTSVMVANILGCFVIGLFSPAQLLDIDSGVACAALPHCSSWQQNTLLLIGLRTGYCGCLTTFASWMLDLLTNAITYDRYPDMLFGLLVGTQTSLFSVLMGQHVSMVLYRVWQGQRFSSFPTAPLPSVESVVDALEDVDRQGYEQTIQQRMSENPLPTMRSTNSTSLDSKASGAAGGGPPASRTPPGGQVFKNGDGAADEEDPDVSPFTTVGTVESKPPTVEAKPTPVPPLLPDSIRAATGRLCQTRTDLAHIVLCAASAILFALLFALYDNGSYVHQSTRMWFFSIVVAPLGCYIRWQLGRLNFMGKGMFKYFPSGTLAANMLGTAITFALQCIAQRLSLGYWGYVVVVGMQTGFCGSLTTVSTFAIEVLGSVRMVRDGVLIGYIYVSVTLLGGVLLGLSVYGWSVWA